MKIVLPLAVGWIVTAFLKAPYSSSYPTKPLGRPPRRGDLPWKPKYGLFTLETITTEKD